MEDSATEPLATLALDHNWVTFTVSYAAAFDKRRTTKHTQCCKILERIEATHGVVSIAATALELLPKAPVELRALPPRVKDGSATKSADDPGSALSIATCAVEYLWT